MSDIIFWDIARGEKRATFAIREDVIWDIGATFSPDSQILALSFSASQYDDWLGRATGGMFPGSQRVLAVPPSNGIKLLDVETGKVFATFEGSHWGEFSPDCKMWAMHGTDGTIQIWDVPARSGVRQIVLWSIFGLLAAAIICWWLRRTYRRAQDRADLTSISPGTVASP